jgi:CDP-diacylglycerol---serine O-phosphatidyltransferase
MTTPATPASCLHPANLLTYGALLAGIGATAMAMGRRPGAAGALIAVAAFADTFDGRFARLFERSDAERAFGVQLDSLSDAVALGVAPPICCALLSPSASLAGLWWLGAFAYAACAVTRLGFYNLSHDEVTGFIGLPVPVAALLVSSALLVGPPGVLSLVAVATAGLLMIAPLPLPRPRGAGLALFALWPIALVVIHLNR